MHNMRCFAYSFSRSFELSKLLDFLRSRYQVTQYEEAIHVHSSVVRSSEEEGDIFIFPYGALVSWGLNEVEEKKLCKELEEFLSERLGAIDDDLYSYGYGAAASIKEDHIVLPKNDVLNKLACSFALAQSVKLGGFEETIQNIFEKTKDLPERMAKKGSIHLSRTQIRKLMGRIFVDRTSINLHLELLDAPSFFWNNTDLEPLHEMINEYLEQRQRMTVLNQRLAVLQELLDMLATELNNQHSSKLEWIIIILIAIEVVLMLGKEFLHIF